MTKKKSLLYFCSELPYPITKGIRVRQATQIEALTEVGQVTVITTHTGPTEVADLCNVPPNIRVKIWPVDVFFNQPSPWRRLFSLEPYYVTHPGFREYHRNRFLSLLRSEVFELIWVSRLKCAWTLGDLGGTSSVLDLDEEEAEARRRRLSLIEDRNLIERLSANLDLKRLHRIEQSVCRRFSFVTLSSGLEMTRVNLPHTRLLPNCPPSQVDPVSRFNTSASHLLFIGTLKYDPNLHGLRWFLRCVWPRLRSSYPKLKLDVVGEGGDAYSDIQAISGVQVHGYVPEPSAYWERAALAIVPVFAGGGTRIKILDAWQRCVPVVSTTIGVEGLDTVSGVHLFIADTPDEFACACERLLGSHSLREQIAQRASALIEAFYNQKAIKGAIREIVQSTWQASFSS